MSCEPIFFMALRNQPYFPLYVQDYLTDEKLNMCSASTQGIYIKILCIFHKSENYGGILFKQNNKQNLSMTDFFAYAIQRQIGFSDNEIKIALDELIENKVLIIDDDFLFQKRMVKDFEVSLKRSESGKKGGGNPNLFKQNPKQKVKQKDKQNPEYEYEYENTNENIIKNSIGEGSWIIEKNNFLNDFRWADKFCRDKNCPKVVFDQKILDFVNEIELRNECKPKKELQSHFVNWFKKNNSSNGKSLSAVSNERMDAAIQYANRYAPKDGTGQNGI